MMGSQKLLVTIIQKGYAKKMIRVAMEKGLRGATVLKGRGTVNPAIFESLSGLSYNPDRDVIFTVVDTDQLKTLQDLFMQIGKMNKKNTGIMFVIDINSSTGIRKQFDL